MKKLRIAAILLISAFALSACSKESTMERDVDAIRFEVDGQPVLCEDWKAEYMGRYETMRPDGEVATIDRLSADGTGEAYYYHVVTPRGSMDSKDTDALLELFAEGGIDDLGGGKGILEWLSMYQNSSSFKEEEVSLADLLARGGPEDEGGFIDYSIGVSGLVDVYVVEMLLNGHITGKYGKTTLRIGDDAQYLNKMGKN